MDIEALKERETLNELATMYELYPESKVSIKKQCKILGLSRTAHYYKPKGESKENL